jgi:hypothetical protein
MQFVRRGPIRRQWHIGKGECPAAANVSKALAGIAAATVAR